MLQSRCLLACGTRRKTEGRIENAHFCHPEHFRGLKPRIGKQKRQQSWHLPCCKHSTYFKYGVILRKTPHNEGVSSILAHIAGGMSISDILLAFPQLSEVAVNEALRFAAQRIQEIYIPLKAA
jgi:hypothetical protein